jgi:hypothetical protein
MLQPKEKELLLTLKDSAHGRVLKAFIENEIRKLSDVTTVESWEDTLGRKNAIIVLRKILGYLNMEDKKQKLPSQYQ